MSLDYIITSKLSIVGSTSSRLTLNSNGNSISLVTPSLLSNTYNIVLPSNNGLQDQVLGLNSNLETDWINENNSSVRAFSVSDRFIFTFSSGVFVTVQNMIITAPPAGRYYCIFNTHSTVSVEFAIFVGSVFQSDSLRIVSNILTIDRHFVNVNGVVVVDGTQDIEIRARSTGFGGVDVFERSLFIYSVL